MTRREISTSEQKFIDAWEANPATKGFVYVMNTHFCNRAYEIDFLFPAQKVAVEIQGGTWLPGGGGHTGGIAQRDDCEKFIILTQLGYKVLPITSDMLTRERAPWAVRQVLRVLRGEGYDPRDRMPKSRPAKSKAHKKQEAAGQLDLFRAGKLQKDVQSKQKRDAQKRRKEREGAEW